MRAAWVAAGFGIWIRCTLIGQERPAAEALSTLRLGKQDSQQSVEINNHTFHLVSNVPGRPPDERLLLRKTAWSKELIGDKGIEAKVTLEAWPLGTELSRKPLYKLSTEGLDGIFQDGLFIVDRATDPDVSWWSVFRLGDGRLLFDTYVPLVSFSISRQTLEVRYAGLELPPDDTQDARLKDPHVVSVVTYASAGKVIREALITCDNVKRATELRSYWDTERQMTTSESAGPPALRIRLRGSPPSPPSPATLVIPIAHDDLDLVHATIPAGLHIAKWQRSK